MSLPSQFFIIPVGNTYRFTYFQQISLLYPILSSQAQASFLASLTIGLSSAVSPLPSTILISLSSLSLQSIPIQQIQTWISSLTSQQLSAITSSMLLTTNGINQSQLFTSTQLSQFTSTQIDASSIYQLTYDDNNTQLASTPWLSGLSIYFQYLTPSQLSIINNILYTTTLYPNTKLIQSFISSIFLSLSIPAQNNFLSSLSLSQITLSNLHTIIDQLTNQLTNKLTNKLSTANVISAATNIIGSITSSQLCSLTTSDQNNLLNMIPTITSISAISISTLDTTNIINISNTAPTSGYPYIVTGYGILTNTLVQAIGYDPITGMLTLDTSCPIGPIYNTINIISFYTLITSSFSTIIGSKEIIAASLPTISQGMFVYGNGIPLGTTITSIINNTVILSQNATNTGTTTIYFYPSTPIYTATTNGTYTTSTVKVVNLSSFPITISPGMITNSNSNIGTMINSNTTSINSYGFGTLTLNNNVTLSINTQLSIYNAIVSNVSNVNNGNVTSFELVTLDSSLINGMSILGIEPTKIASITTTGLITLSDNTSLTSLQFITFYNNNNQLILSSSGINAVNSFFSNISSSNFNLLSNIQTLFMYNIYPSLTNKSQNNIFSLTQFSLLTSTQMQLLTTTQIQTLTTTQIQTLTNVQISYLLSLQLTTTQLVSPPVTYTVSSLKNGNYLNDIGITTTMLIPSYSVIYATVTGESYSSLTGKSATLSTFFNVLPNTTLIFQVNVGGGTVSSSSYYSGGGYSGIFINSVSQSNAIVVAGGGGGGGGDATISSGSGPGSMNGESNSDRSGGGGGYYGGKSSYFGTGTFQEPSTGGSSYVNTTVDNIPVCYNVNGNLNYSNPSITFYYAKQSPLITTSQLISLTTTQIQGLTSTDIQLLTTTQIQLLTSTQIQSLTTYSQQLVSIFTNTQIQSLTSTQINLMSSSQIQKITQSLSTTQIQYLQRSLIQSLNVKSLTSTQIQSLTSTQIQILSTTQIEAILLQQYIDPITNLPKRYNYTQTFLQNSPQINTQITLNAGCFYIIATGKSNGAKSAKINALVMFNKSNIVSETGNLQFPTVFTVNTGGGTGLGLGKNGGGYSGIFINSISQPNAMIIAAGSGGSFGDGGILINPGTGLQDPNGYNHTGGNAGIISINNGIQISNGGNGGWGYLNNNNNNGLGATLTSAGLGGNYSSSPGSTNGGPLNGGNSSYNGTLGNQNTGAGGGGGGYFGGGAGS